MSAVMFVGCLIVMIGAFVTVALDIPLLAGCAATVLVALLVMWKLDGR